MGNDNSAIKPEEDPVVIKAETPEDEPIESGDEDGEEAEVATENEVFLEGDEGSQPDKQIGIKKRINKLNAKRDEAVAETTEAERKLAISEEQNKLLRMAVEQNQAVAPTPPDPKDFDDGVKDPKYVQAFNEYNEPLIDAAVQRRTSHLAQVKDEGVDPNLVKMQTKHYERADELAIKDFEEVEDKAISILGKETVNGLVQNSTNSHLVLYYLGKNPDKAEAYAELIKTNPVKAILDLGALGTNLSVGPKHKTEPTPDPDEELQGGSPSAGQSNKHQSLVDKARQAVHDGTADMSAIIKAKKDAKAAGVTIK